MIGDSPNFTNGHLGDALSALESLELLIVHDSFLTPLAQRAHVVLPRVTFAEKEGTFTNLERRVQRVKPGRLSKKERPSRKAGSSVNWPKDSARMGSGRPHPPDDG